MLTIITNGTILTPNGWITNCSLIFDRGRIIRIGRDIEEPRNSKYDQIFDAQGGYVIPGAIDLHVHGGGGHDFMECSEEAFRAAIKTHMRFGTTAIYPTLSASSVEMIERAVAVTERLMAEPDSPIMGLHLEGPYLNPKMAGAQDPQYITPPIAEDYERILSQTNVIKRWDVAPELSGALEFGRYLKSKGVLASVAHTEARYATISSAVEAGYSHATHFYNAMTTVHKNREFKHEGTIESIYLMDEMSVEIIADGIHIPPAVLRMVHKFKGVERTCLVTDAMGCTASDSTTVFDPRVIIEDGVCKLSDRSALAGSIATMDRLIRTMTREAGVPLEDAVRMASESPARIMGIYDRKGLLEEGKDADIVVMTPDLEISAVWAMGRKVENE